MGRHVDTATVRQRARTGATFLDHVEPDWFLAVDPDTLDMASARHCVLGQLHGFYWSGTERYGLTKWVSAELGFDLHFGEYPDADVVDAMADEWRRMIGARW